MKLDLKQGEVFDWVWGRAGNMGKGEGWGWIGLRKKYNWAKNRDRNIRKQQINAILKITITLIM